MRKFNPVKYGSTGTDVYILQALLRALRILGADGKPLEVDGLSRENTVHAIEKFKEMSKAYGCDCSADGNGVFGSASWAYLMGV